MADISGFKTTPNSAEVKFKDSVARGVWSSEVTANANATSATISNSSIATTSVIDVYCQNSNGTSVTINSLTVTSGKVVIAFDALAVQTKFKVHIFNP